MSTDANKTVAFRFFERFTENDINGALDTMTGDATWWIPGKKERSPSAGLYSKDKIGRASCVSSSATTKKWSAKTTKPLAALSALGNADAPGPSARPAPLTSKVRSCLTLSMG